jgi:hypothetical protein
MAKAAADMPGLASATERRKTADHVFATSSARTMKNAIAAGSARARPGTAKEAARAPSPGSAVVQRSAVSAVAVPRNATAAK